MLLTPKLEGRVLRRFHGVSLPTAPRRVRDAADDAHGSQIYSDLYRYAPDKNEWRRFTSPTSPGPRSAHQIVASPAGGGKLWLFGGEFCEVARPVQLSLPLML